LINCRIVAAGLRVTEVSSFERDRLHGTSNLSTFRDGMRVLRVIVSEYLGVRKRNRRDRQATRIDKLAKAVTRG